MSISVVIPVHNAEKFVRAAVFSAVQQKEVSEILLIDDGSSDGSLQTCYQAAADYERVRVLQHAQGRHQGLVATRNLGIREAQQDFVAFLDSDDYFLPRRFAAPLRALLLRPEIDGIYEAVETFFEPESDKDKYFQIHNKTLISMDAAYTNQDLFTAIASGEHGYPNLMGMLFRKEALVRVGMFDDGLEMHDNTALILKMAASANLVPGRLQKAVTRHRIHTDNQSLNEPWNMREMWKVLWDWSKQQSGLSSELKNQILSYYLSEKLGPKPEAYPPRQKLRSMGRMMPLLNQNPGLLKNPVVWGYLKKLLTPFRVSVPETSVTTDGA